MSWPCLPVRRCLALVRRSSTLSRHSSALKTGPGPDITHQSDSHGLPIHPVWSVNELLSSNPTPTLSSSTMKRLHDLSALISPEEGTAEFTKQKRELEELVRLVEAVKVVNTEGVQPVELRPALGDGAEEEEADTESSEGEVDGRSLLKHATRTVDDLYVVEAKRHH